MVERVPLPRGERAVPVMVGPMRGARLPIDLSTVERHLWMNTYEPWFQRTLLGMLEPSMVVWDIGAYIGYYVALASRRTRGGPIVAVEPLTDNLRRLDRTITMNQIPNVTVVRKAVGKEVAQMRFAGSGPLGAITAEGEETVPVTTLDDLLRDQPMPGLLLMDIEGGEVAAISGGGRLLTHVRPPILVELHGALGVEASRMLDGLDYRLRTQAEATIEAQMEHTHRIHALATPK